MCTIKLVHRLGRQELESADHIVIILMLVYIEVGQNTPSQENQIKKPLKPYHDYFMGTNERIITV